MRCIQKAYDAENAGKSMDEVLGVHAAMGRYFNSNFLCLVVLLEPLLEASDVDAATMAWDALSYLGFGLVPVPVRFAVLYIKRWAGGERKT